jgi:hypothetical protein
MGAKTSKYIPKYFKYFNIENRALKKIDAIDQGQSRPLVSPRHPSTAKILKEMEGKKS